MNLIYIIRKYLIISLLIITIIGCISHYFIFKIFINYSTDSVLYEYKEKIKDYVNIYGTFNAYSVSMLPSRIEEHLILDDPSKYPEIIKDTLIHNYSKNKQIPYRQLYFNVYYEGSWHRVVISQPTIEQEDLIYVVISSLISLFILLILFTYFISYYLKWNIWLPFYKNLKVLNDYDLKAKTSLDLKEIGIKEFDQLNEVVLKMVKKINEDYENSRMFLEDTSHEMQTPLSVIKSKSDLLMQSTNLREEDIQSVNTISRTVSRLARLNKSLLVLTKINNGQFQNYQVINVSSIIENYLIDIEELMQSKEIKLAISLETLVYYIDPVLADMLISNLLTNSIKHNIVGGEINISVKQNILTIRNSCIQALQTNNLFKRLVHREKSEESIGLGLNIVKSICDKNNLKVEYEYLTSTQFQIRIWFNNFNSSSRHYS